MFLLGPLLVLIFTLSQSVRDVYFGSAFQRLDFFLVILLAFSWSTVIFAATTLIRAPYDLAKLRAQRWPITAANVTTAVAWTSFFFALTHVDPAICNTIHSAMGPLTVVVLGARGVALAKPEAISRASVRHSSPRCRSFRAWAACSAAVRLGMRHAPHGREPINKPLQEIFGRTAERSRHQSGFAESSGPSIATW